MRNMTIYFLDKENETDFPPIDQAKSSGLLAVGGNLSTTRILSAYKQGIFPWYDENAPIMWWSPDPRCVLIPSELKISRSLQKAINKNPYQITFNHAFENVIKACASVPRPGQSGTWLLPEMIEAYSQLHAMGHAHSVEAWEDGKLVGGLYGIILGKVFFGESMFHTRDNASKIAFVHFVKHLQEKDFKLIDCQQTSSHMLKMGAKEISRKQFSALLQNSI